LGVATHLLQVDANQGASFAYTVHLLLQQSTEPGPVPTGTVVPEPTTVPTEPVEPTAIPTEPVEPTAIPTEPVEPTATP
jgi:hypothetical protein